MNMFLYRYFNNENELLDSLHLFQLDSSIDYTSGKDLVFCFVALLRQLDADVMIHLKFICHDTVYFISCKQRDMIKIINSNLRWTSKLNTKRYQKMTCICILLSTKRAHYLALWLMINFLKIAGKGLGEHSVTWKSLSELWVEGTFPYILNIQSHVTVSNLFSTIHSPCTRKTLSKRQRFIHFYREYYSNNLTRNI